MSGYVSYDRERLALATQFYTPDRYPVISSLARFALVKHYELGADYGVLDPRVGWKSLPWFRIAEWKIEVDAGRFCRLIDECVGAGIEDNDALEASKHVNRGRLKCWGGPRHNGVWHPEWKMEAYNYLPAERREGACNVLAKALEGC